jgi:hypothetical protein
MIFIPSQLAAHSARYPNDGRDAAKSANSVPAVNNPFGTADYSSAFLVQKTETDSNSELRSSRLSSPA